MTSNFTRYAQKGDYRPVKNSPCLNMVTAVIDYYKRQPHRLKVILLDQTHWRLLVEELRRIDNAYPINATEGVQFDGCDVTVRKGSMFQDRAMKYEFYSEMELISIVHGKA